MKLDPEDPCTPHLFGILDSTGQGFFDFYTLVQGLILVSGALGESEKVRLVFEMYDKNKDGRVDLEELVMMMRRKPLIPSEEDPNSKVY